MELEGIVRATELVFPLFGGKVIKEEKHFEPQCLVGTCFFIGGNTFITAGHVLEQLESYESRLLGFIYKNQGDQYKYLEIARQEIYTDIDIGIFQLVAPLNFDCAKISLEQCYALDDVISSGFPFGLDNKEKGIYLRSFKGYIVSAYRRESGKFNAKCYELSIQCPRGISGAPLIYFSKEAKHIVGVIIGSQSSEVEIGDTVEEFKSGGREIYERRVEVTRFGIAVDINELMNLSPSFLGKSIGEHLVDMNLLET
jgi:hypothetical protein